MTMSEEKAEKNACNKHPVKDHLGHEFGSFEQMCRYWRIDQATVRRRLKEGYSLARALTEVVMTSSIRNGVKCKDHLGKEFKQQAAMCRYWRIPCSVFRYRINTKKMSIEEALTSPVKQTYDPVYTKRGKLVGYGMQNQANELGLTSQQLKNRLEKGIGKNKLSQPLVNGRSKKCKDHLGQKFDQLEDMCRQHNISVAAFNYRLQQGYSVEDALTLPLNHGKTVVVGDKVYSSISSACKDNNIDPQTYTYRLQQGLSVEDALSPERLRMREALGKQCEDHLGNKYIQTKQMCDHYGIQLQTYMKRIQRGYSVKDALETPVRQKKGQNHGQ